MIENGDIWMAMIKSRNLTSHTYYESTAAQIVKAILEVYFAEFHALQAKLQHLKGEESA